MSFQANSSSSNDGHYDAFLSYSHKTDARFGASLHHNLQIFGVGFFKSRDVRIFLDNANVAMTEDLWKNQILPAIQKSSRFLLLASPSSSKSAWVSQEIKEFRATKTGGIYIILSSGKSPWTDDDFDADAEDAAVSKDVIALFGNSRPYVVDLRPHRSWLGTLRRNGKSLGLIAAIKSGITNRPKDDLWGAHLTELRRRVMVLSALVFFTLVAFGIAIWQKGIADASASEAEKQERIALGQKALAQNAEREANSKLFDSLLNQSVAIRATTNPDRRTIGEKLVSNATSILRHLDDKKSAILRCRNELAHAAAIPAITPSLANYIPSSETLAEIVTIPPIPEGFPRLPLQTGFGVAADDAYRFRSWHNGLIAVGRDGEAIVVPSGGFPVRILSNRTAVRLTKDEQTWLPQALSENGELCVRLDPIDGSLKLARLIPEPENRILADKSGKPLNGQCICKFNESGTHLIVLMVGQQIGPIAGNASLRWLLFSTKDAVCQGEWTNTMFIPECIVLSPDGKLLVASESSRSRVLRLFRSSDGFEVSMLPVEQLGMWAGFNRQNRIDFSKDGSLLAATGEDGIVKIWFLQKTAPAIPERGHLAPPGYVVRELGGFRAHEGGIAATRGAIGCKFSPDNRWLLTAGGDYSLKVWSLDNFSLSASIPLGRSMHMFGDVTSIIWNSTGTEILCMTSGGLSSWNFAAPCVHNFNVGIGHVPRKLEFNAEGDLLAYGTALINLKDSTVNVLADATLRGATCFSPEGLMFYAAKSYGDVTAYHLPSNSESYSQKCRLTETTDIAIKKNGNLIANGTRAKSVLTLIDPRTGRAFWTRDDAAGNNRYGTFAFSQDGAKIALLTAADEATEGNNKSHVAIVEIASGNSIVEKTFEEMSLRGGNVLYRGNDPIALVRIADWLQLNLNNGQVLNGVVEARTPGVIPTPVTLDPQIRLSASGERAATIDDHGNLTIHDLLTGSVVKSIASTSILTNQNEILVGFELSEDGRAFAVVTNKGLGYWSDGDAPASFVPVTDVICIKFLADKNVGILQRSGRVSVWEPGTDAVKVRSQIPDVIGLKTSYPQCRMSPSGRYVAIAEPLPGPDWLAASVKPNFGVTVWDISAGEPVPQPMSRHFGSLEAFEFEKNSDRLAVLTLHDAHVLYDAAEGKILSEIPSFAGELPGSLSSSGAFYLVSKGDAHDTLAEVWKIGESKAVLQIRMEKNTWIRDVASNDSLLVVNEGRRIHVCRDGEHSPIENPETDRTFTHCALGLRDNIMAVAVDNDSIQIWDLNQIEQLISLTTSFSTISRVAVSPTGEFVAVADDQGRVCVWSLSKLRTQLAISGVNWPFEERKRPLNGGTDELAARQESWKLLLEGEIHKAIDLLTIQIKQNPSSAVLYRDRADLFQRVNDIDGAIGDLRMVHAIDPKFKTGYQLATLLHHKSSFAVEARNYALAKTLLEEAITSWDRNADEFAEYQLVQILASHIYASLADNDRNSAARTCAFGIKRCAQSRNFAEIASVCVLVPDDVIDWHAVKVAISLKKFARNRSFVVDEPYTLGAIFILSGDTDRGIVEIEQIPPNLRTPLCELFLALGFAKLKKFDLARERIKVSEELIKNLLDGIDAQQREFASARFSALQQDVRKLLE